MGLHKYSVPKPINCHGTFHKYYLLCPTYHPNSPQNMLIISLPKLGHKLHYPQGKTQRKPKIQSPTMMWLIPKSHYDVANSMFHYDVANSKPATILHYLQIQSPLRCGTIYKFKPRYDAALFTKPVVTRKYFTKSQNHFYKAQILIWHLFSRSPNFNWTLFYKAQILSWQFFIKLKY